MWGLALTAVLLWGLLHTAHSGVSMKSASEGNNTFLFCLNDGKVTWEKGVDGGRLALLTAGNGAGVIEHKHDRRYGVLSDLSLLIKNLSLSDSGLYYCNSTPVVYLNVTPSHRSTAENKKVSSGDGIETKPVLENESERKVSGVLKEKDDDDEHDDDDEEFAVWTAAAVGGMSCVLVLLVGLIMWRVFTRRKGGPQNQVHMYDSVNHLPTAPQPAELTVTHNETHVYASIRDLSDVSQCQEQRGTETVYFLAQNPTTITPSTDPIRSDQLYAVIQKPVNNTGLFSLQHD